MILKSLSKKLAILILSLISTMPVAATQGNGERSMQTFTIPCLVSEDGQRVTAKVHSELFSGRNIEFRNNKYTEKKWISFLIINLLFGPYIHTTTCVEFCSTPPSSYSRCVTQGNINAYMSEGGKTLTIVCPSIAYTVNNIYTLQQAVATWLLDPAPAEKSHSPIQSKIL